MIMSADDYKYLYGKLESSKIPNDIHTKLMEGEDLTAEEETRIKAIIEKEKPKKPVDFERSLRNMIPKDYLKRNRYILVNLSSDDDIDIYKTVMERNLEAVFLDTYRIIPTRPINFFGFSTFYNLVDYVTPICFFIDRLDDIDYTKNAEWFRLRNNSNDFFIDKLGVVKKVDKLKFGVTL